MDIIKKCENRMLFKSVRDIIFHKNTDPLLNLNSTDCSGALSFIQ